MNYKEKKKEELKKEGKKQWPIRKTGKECPACETINELNAKFCQECGYKFFKEGTKKPEEPASQIVQEKKDEKGKEVKEEVKEKKKSFFSQTQKESIRKSEEEMKNKEETTKVKAVEIIKVQKANVREIQKRETISSVVYVTDSMNHRLQKFTSEGEFITKWGSKGSGDGKFERPYGIAISKV